MSPLENPRHEAFAQARAKGLSAEDAYEDAGFVPGNGHAQRLALRPEVAARIGELRSWAAEMESSRTQALITALLRVARAAELDGSPTALKEARLTLVEVARLRAVVDLDRRADREALLAATEETPRG